MDELTNDKALRINCEQSAGMITVVSSQIINDDQLVVNVGLLHDK